MRRDKLRPAVSGAIDGAAPGFLGGGGEMGALMRAHDWSGSSLGLPARWPQSLRTVVRLMLNTGHPMYVFWGADRACLYNDAYRESIGPERHPGSLGRPAREVWDEIWDIIGPQIEQVMSGGGATWHVDHLVPITRHGRREDVFWTYSYSPIDEESAPGGIGGVLVVCSETTQQVLAARQLTTERDQLAQLFEQAPTFMALLRGPEHRIELANPGYLQLVGHRDVLGRTVAEALPDAVQQGYLSKLDEVFTSGRAHAENAARYIVQATPGGPITERVVDFVFQPIKDGDGRVTAIFVEGADVTDRARANAALQLLEPRLHGLLETIPGFIWTADAAGEIDYISPRFVAFVGRDEARFKSAFWPEFIHPEDMPRLVAEWTRVNAMRISYKIDLRFLRHDGVWRWLVIRAEPELDADGRILRWYGYGEDQHEQKEIADALTGSEARFRELAERLSQSLAREQEARLAADQANRAKDEFLAMLGHELRNPLAPILTALELMRLRGATDRERTVIERQVTHLHRLVDDLLDVSRVTRGKIQLKQERLELADVVARAVELVSPMLEDRQQKLIVAVPTTGLAVRGDATRLAQIVSNLLTNASKYGQVNSRVELTGIRAADQIVLTVIDNGCGISAELLPHIFDLFTQDAQRMDRSQGGLGLGLAIVRSLVTLHGGTVEARSDGLDRGSQFIVRLPADTSATHVDPVATNPADGSLAPRQPAARRILVVDDNKDAADLLAEALRLSGHCTQTAYDGPSALEAARAFRPDLALLDIGLPLMDGYELAQRLKDTPGLEAIQLVALTGYGQSLDRSRSEAAGFDEHLVKPTHVEKVKTVLAQLTDGKARREAAPDPSTS